jgi:hypothetical protein
MATTTCLKIGEDYIAGRLRYCFPARLRDEYLPSDDETLALRIVAEMNANMLTSKVAFEWLLRNYQLVTQNADDFEVGLLRHRINKVFAEQCGVV